MAEKINPIFFIDYDKISDTIMWFNQNYTLKFNVILKRRTKEGAEYPFHSEYKSLNPKSDKEYLSISRSFNFYFSIDNRINFNNGIMLRPNDIELLSMVIQNNIYPWFSGKTSVFGTDDQGKRVLKGKVKDIAFPLSDQKYISFRPILIEYDNGQSSEAIRIVINKEEDFFDITINKFMEFAYYIIHTDMYTAATNLLTYVKTKPYLVNYKDLTENYGYNRNSQNNYFQNI